MKLESTQTFGWEAAVRGMRNPMDSHDRSDSKMEPLPFTEGSDSGDFIFGENDRCLALRLIRSGPPHQKFLRQIFASVDITAPLYWWKQHDTYRAGVEKDSCSTMHTIHKREFRLDDFALDDTCLTQLSFVVDMLNDFRRKYLDTKDKKYWYAMIRLLPQSYMQKRTVTMSYAAIAAMCRQRKGHRLIEWQAFIDWAKSLPNSWLLFQEDEESEEVSE